MVINHINNTIQVTQFLPVSELELIKQVEADMNELLDHVDRYKPKYIEIY